MPVVPRLGVQQVDEQMGPQRLQSANAPIGAFGGGQGLDRAANSLAGLVDEVDKQAAQTMATNAKTELNNLQNKLIYGEQDENGNYTFEGLVQKKGQNAFGFSQEIDKEFERKRAEIESKLSGRAREYFTRDAQQVKMSIDDTVSKYMAGETQRFYDETYKNYILSEKNVAANSYGDINKINQSLNNIESRMSEYLNTQGIKPGTEAYNMKVLEVKSTVHADVIDRMLADGNGKTALGYLEANKNQMTQKDYEDAKKGVEIEVIRSSSQSLVDDFMRKGYDEERAYQEAEKLNPKLREETEQRIALQYNRQKQAEYERSKNLFEIASRQFNENGDIDKVSANILKQMKPEHLTAFKSFIDSNPYRDTTKDYYRLMKLASNPDTRDSFKDHDLLKELPNLNKEHFNALLRIQNDLRGSGGTDNVGKANKELDGIFSDNQALENVYLTAGKDPKRDKDAYAKYLSQANEMVMTAQKEKGSKLNNFELQQIGEKLMKEKVLKEGRFFDTKRYPYLIEYEDIPKEMIEPVKASLIQENKATTKENILRQYRLIKIAQDSEKEK